jgi:hypothetical protein
MFLTTLLVDLGFLALLPFYAFAQNVTIDSIDIPDGSTIVAGSDYLSSANATFPDDFGYSVRGLLFGTLLITDGTKDHPGSYELLSTSLGVQLSQVVDIMCQL